MSPFPYAYAAGIGFVVWYLYYGFEVFLNCGPSVWKCLKEEISWEFLPGGRQRKADYIKRLVDRFDEGWIDNYKYSEIKQLDLYDEVARKVLPGKLHFLGTHILLPLTPVFLVFLYYNVAS